MSDFHYSILSWDHGAAELKSFNTISRTKGAVLKIELLVQDSRTLGNLMRDLAEIQENQQKRKAATNLTSRNKKAASKAEERLALPAPTPRLTHG